MYREMKTTISSYGCSGVLDHGSHDSSPKNVGICPEAMVTALEPRLSWSIQVLWP